MDCVRCDNMEERYRTWGSGVISPILWCLEYQMPVEFASRQCEIRKDEK